MPDTEGNHKKYHIVQVLMEIAFGGEGLQAHFYFNGRSTGAMGAHQEGFLEEVTFTLWKKSEKREDTV